MTGYDREAAIGTNCRFLQGAETRAAAVDVIRGGSAVIAPAVALPESNADGSDGRGPAVQQCTQFIRCTTESY